MTDLISSIGTTEGAKKAADQKFCFSCGTVLHVSAAHCPKCGATQPLSGSHTVPPALVSANEKPIGLPPHHVFCRGCGTAIHESASACPKCGAVQRLQGSTSSASGKERITAALLAFFLGGFGAHKFYLGRGVQGVLYLLFCWTFVPAIIALIEGIVYLTMSDADFNRKYG